VCFSTVTQGWEDSPTKRGGLRAQQRMISMKPAPQEHNNSTGSTDAPFEGYLPLTDVSTCLW
jgi:hypothetical protein